jgi:hypothetical protein
MLHLKEHLRAAIGKSNTTLSLRGYTNRVPAERVRLGRCHHLQLRPGIFQRRACKDARPCVEMSVTCRGPFGSISKQRNGRPAPGPVNLDGIRHVSSGRNNRSVAVKWNISDKSNHSASQLTTGSGPHPAILFGRVDVSTGFGPGPEGQQGPDVAFRPAPRESRDGASQYRPQLP